jgi:hypothetical protein
MNMLVAIGIAQQRRGDLGRLDEVAGLGAGGGLDRELERVGREGEVRAGA